MKTKLLIALTALLALAHVARAQGTAFTYQGRLDDGGTTATGMYDLAFTLFDDPANGTAVSQVITNTATPVSNGLFTVTLDFGSGIFSGDARWLEIGVQTNGGTNFITLAPRQALTPTPYAMFAKMADGANLANQVSNGSVGPAQLGTPSAPAAGQLLSYDGTSLIWSSADTVGSSNAWLLGGNSGTLPGANFLGTIDNQPLELRVNSNRAQRWEPVLDSNWNSATANVIGGGAGNMVSNGIFGAFIGGGGNGIYGNSAGGNNSAIIGGIGNTTSGDYALAMGLRCDARGSTSVALGNSAQATGTSAFAAGDSCLASGNYSVAIGNNLWSSGNNSVTLGQGARASGPCSMATGNSTMAPGQYATAMGYQTTADGFVCTALGYSNYVAGSASAAMGQFNTAIGSVTMAFGYHILNHGNSSIGLGANCQVQHDACFMWSDGTLPFSTARPYTFNALATGGYLFYTGSGVGVQVAAGGNAWSVISDRNQKENSKPVDCRAVLDQVVTMPVTTWNLKTQPETVRHIGPMAQDFQAAFHVGEDDKHISTSDADGVTFAAIKGLNEKLEAENTELNKRLAKLEALVEQLLQAQKN